MSKLIIDVRAQVGALWREAPETINMTQKQWAAKTRIGRKLIDDILDALPEPDFVSGSGFNFDAREVWIYLPSQEDAREAARELYGTYTNVVII